MEEPNIFEPSALLSNPVKIHQWVPMLLEEARLTAGDRFFWKTRPKPEDINEFKGKINNCQESSLQAPCFDTKIPPFHDVAVFDRSLPAAHLASYGCR